MKGLLIRVGVDQSDGGGHWNGPMNSRTGQFAYVPIPETKPNRPGHEQPYTVLSSSLTALGVSLPAHLVDRRMHLDPDFEHLTYGDRGKKGTQISNALGNGDVLVFYSGLLDVEARRLAYAIIGLFVIERIDKAVNWPESAWHRNAHTRRELPTDADDVIVAARPGNSGKLLRCLPIGEYRDRAYRVRKDLLEAWGGISANDGYLQRSAVFPTLLDPERFLAWFVGQKTRLVAENFLR